jgi:hypothetical protein
MRVQLQGVMLVELIGEQWIEWWWVETQVLLRGLSKMGQRILGVSQSQSWKTSSVLLHYVLRVALWQRLGE